MADSNRMYIIWSCAMAIYHQIIRSNTKHTKYNPWPVLVLNMLLLIRIVLITTRQPINRDLAGHSSDSNQTHVDSASRGLEGIQLDIQLLSKSIISIVREAKCVRNMFLILDWNNTFSVFIVLVLIPSAYKISVWWNGTKNLCRWLALLMISQRLVRSCLGATRH